MLSSADLDQIAGLVGQGPAPGYPALDRRLYLETPGLREDGPVLVVPDGPWHVTGHPNRAGVPAADLDPEVPDSGAAIEPALADRWRADGLTLDQHDRPVHPDWRRLLADPRIGLPTGVGFFYRYGPNATVDPFIYRRRGAAPVEVLLIKRLRGGRWALPGGFADRTDRSAEDTARREAGEETGLDAIGGTAETLLYNRSVGTIATLHAWTENTVVLIHGDQDYLNDTEPVPGDDAVDARWCSPEQIADLDLFDVHAGHIDAALRRLAVDVSVR
jgi:8-oxo-dGTP pyrophosphatase MutT (NUDIX family)